MSFRTLSFVALGCLAALSAAACSASPVEEDGSDDALSEKNLGANSFNLQEGELVLTLDDGPGARTKELIDFLVAEKIPATFFMVGKNAGTTSGKSTMEYIAQRSSDVPGGLIIANHSMTHTDPLPKQGVSGSVKEINDADRILHDFIKLSQQHLSGEPVSFFRPPYGAFTALGSANIARVNAQGGSAYVGPVFWEIGGELKNGYSADWACWGRNGVSIDTCRDGYIKEAIFRKKGIVLCHDVHSKTIDMLIGKGTKSLIKALQETSYDPRDPSKKFKFVSMRKDASAVEGFRQATERERATADQIVARTEVEQTTQTRVGGVSVIYDVGRVPGATKATVTFDRGPQEGDRPVAKAGTVDDDGQLGPGQHFVVVSALDDDNNVLTQNRFNLIVPALFDRAPEGEGTACTNYHKLKEVRRDGRTAGRPFKLFHGRKPGCAGDGAECFTYNGTAKVAAIQDGRTAAVHAIGGDEWSVEYDLTYASAPTDKTKLSLVLESETGKIVTGRRIRPNGSDMATFHESSVDCDEGIWRGKFVYKNGSEEEFLFRAPIASEPEYNDR